MRDGTVQHRLWCWMRRSPTRWLGLSTLIPPLLLWLILVAGLFLTEPPDPSYREPAVLLGMGRNLLLTLGPIGFAAGGILYLGMRQSYRLGKKQGHVE